MRLSFGKKTGKKKAQGKFIVIDGTDGSGKATQLKLLVETLHKEGFVVEKMDFPQYDTKSAGPLEKYLSDKYGDMEPKAASVLYAVDRYDASFKIRAALDEGKIVIADRYVTSNAGHQGSKITKSDERVKYFRWLDDLEYNVFKIPKPDLNIILHIPAEVTHELMMKRAKDDNRQFHIHEDSLVSQQRAEAVYLEIAKLFPNTKLVECMRGGKLMTPSEVHNKVWEFVRRIVLKNTLPSKLTKS